jgi:1-acyl-sn-glycerol-3-phosphate acyltransferase
MGRAFFRLLIVLVYGYQVEGREHVPSEGGVLIVSNHAHALDPPFVGVATNRPVHFMAKEELFRILVLGWALPRVHAFPVRRDGLDRTAVRTAIRLLRSGHVVGLFPEGTRSQTGRLMPFQRGVGLIALKAGAPVVPVGLVGTFQPISWNGWRPRINQFTARFGPPMDLASIAEENHGKEGIDRACTLMMEGVEQLITPEPEIDPPISSRIHEP